MNANLSPSTVILNLFQDPFRVVTRRCRTGAIGAVALSNAAPEQSARWVLKQVQHDEIVFRRACVKVLAVLGGAFIALAVWKFLSAFWLPPLWMTRRSGPGNNWRNEAWMAEEDGVSRWSIDGTDPGGSENQYHGGDSGGAH